MAELQTIRRQTRYIEAASNFLAAHILDTCVRGERTSLFLSGGSTPGPIYAHLSQYDLPWRLVDTGLVDERWVDETNPGSNAALIHKTFLQNAASLATFTPMKTYGATAIEGQIFVNDIYTPLLRSSCVAVLGMGPDGHTASWFTGANGVDNALDPRNTQAVQAIMAQKTKVTGDYLERMTLTLTALGQCQSLLLLTKGAEKRAVLEQALKGPNPDLPISYLFAKSSDRITILHLEA